MKVSSPVGDFPFAISRVEMTRDGITVRGLMGAWPARVEVGVSDIRSWQGRCGFRLSSAV